MTKVVEKNDPQKITKQNIKIKIKNNMNVIFDFCGDNNITVQIADKVIIIDKKIKCNIIVSVKEEES